MKKILLLLSIVLSFNLHAQVFHMLTLDNKIIVVKVVKQGLKFNGENLENKKIYLTFFGIEDKKSQEEVLRLKKILEKEKNSMVLGIQAEVYDNVKEIKKFKKSLGLNFVICNYNQALPLINFLSKHQLWFDEIPLTLIFDKNGTLISD